MIAVIRPACGVIRGNGDQGVAGLFVLVDEINRALVFSLFYRRGEPVDNDPRVDA